MKREALRFTGIIIFIFISVFFLSGCKGQIDADESGWLGTYTTDSIPVKGYDIDRVGTMITVARRFAFKQKKDFNDPDNYLTQLSSLMVHDLQTELEEQAKGLGYNALVGYRITVAQSLDTDNSDSDIRGRGYAVVMAQAVPVYSD